MLAYAAKLPLTGYFAQHAIVQAFSVEFREANSQSVAGECKGRTVDLFGRPRSLPMVGNLRRSSK
jgi:hypothetical protein